jgi:hypothetical protein
MQLTDMEAAAARTALELIREEYERLQRPTVVMDGAEFATRGYLRRLVDIIAGPPRPFTGNEVLAEFLIREMSKSISRRRVNDTIYHRTVQFSKAWKKGLMGSNRAEKVSKDS